MDNNVADIMTESIASSELFYSPSDASFYSAVAEQAAAQGITYLVASGDSGPDAYDNPNISPATVSTPSVNIRNGNTVYRCGRRNSEIQRHSKSQHVLEFIQRDQFCVRQILYSENVWNESCLLAQCGSNPEGLWSSGGGLSTFFAMPAWQTVVAGIPSTNARFLPDVALTAAGHDGYIACLDGSCEMSPSSFVVFSGTSASVQAFGGVMALVVQKMGARQGQANYVFYKLAAAENLATCNGSNASTLPNGNCIIQRRLLVTPISRARTARR